MIKDDLTGDEDADTQITGYVFEADSYIFQGADDAEATVYSTKFPVELTTGAHVNVLPSGMSYLIIWSGYLFSCKTETN